VRSNFHVASKHVLFELVVCPPKLAELGRIGHPSIGDTLKLVVGLQGGPVEH
jgi:hypothetical protein